MLGLNPLEQLTVETFKIVGILKANQILIKVLLKLTQLATSLIRYAETLLTLRVNAARIRSQLQPLEVKPFSFLVWKVELVKCTLLWLRFYRLINTSYSAPIG